MPGILVGGNVGRVSVDLVQGAGPPPGPAGAGGPSGGGNLPGPFNAKGFPAGQFPQRLPGPPYVAPLTYPTGTYSPITPGGKGPILPGPSAPGTPLPGPHSPVSPGVVPTGLPPPPSGPSMTPGAGPASSPVGSPFPTGTTPAPPGFTPPGLGPSVLPPQMITPGSPTPLAPVPIANVPPPAGVTAGQFLRLFVRNVIAEARVVAPVGLVFVSGHGGEDQRRAGIASSDDAARAAAAPAGFANYAVLKSASGALRADLLAGFASLLQSSVGGAQGGPSLPTISPTGPLGGLFTAGRLTLSPFLAIGPAVNALAPPVEQLLALIGSTPPVIGPARDC